MTRPWILGVLFCAAVGGGGLPPSPPSSRPSSPEQRAGLPSLWTYVTRSTWDAHRNQGFPIVVEILLAPGSPYAGTEVGFLDFRGYNAGKLVESIRNPGPNAHANYVCLTYELTDAGGRPLPFAFNGLIPDQSLELKAGSNFVKTVAWSEMVRGGERLTLRAYLVLDGALCASSDPVPIDLTNNSIAHDPISGR